MDLSGNVLFNGISSEDCEKMSSCLCMSQENYRAGDLIINYGNGCKKIGVVLSGSVMTARYDYDGTRSVLEYLEAGSIFGEAISFSKIRNGNIFVFCEKDAQIAFIDYSRIIRACRDACECHSTLIYNMLGLLSEKALQLSQRVEILSNKSIRAKLISYFNCICYTKGRKTFELPFSIASLADFLCVDRSALTRELKRMHQDGIVFIEKRGPSRRVITLIK